MNSLATEDLIKFDESQLADMRWHDGYPDFVMCTNCKGCNMDCNDSESGVEEWTCGDCGKMWRILFSAIYIYEIEKEI